MSSRTRIRIVGVLAALWNCVGVASYLAHVGVIVGDAPPPGGPVMPAAITASFAIGVFGGVAGSVALALLSRRARPLLWLSWAGTVIDWVWVFGWSGSAFVPLGVTVVVVATLFAVLAEWAGRRGLLR
ncbi:hypothetical protein ACPVPU_06055 [Sphingomonas sp. CJ99]